MQIIPQQIYKNWWLVKREIIEIEGNVISLPMLMMTRKRFVSMKPL
jgi:hypothetical protein